MCDDRIIRGFAGVFILASLALGWWVHPGWLLFTAFVGLNLLQSSFTAFSEDVIHFVYGEVHGEAGATVRTCVNAPEGPIEIEL